MNLVPMTSSGNWPLTTGNFLAAGFVAPAFAVAGVLLACVPIIIHLLNRRRFRVVEWAAMSFLLAALKRNRRRLQLEQWLLLATRCAVLVLLGLALARPVACERTGLAAGATRAGLHVIVIDNSYSMAYEARRPNAVTHLDQAKALAKALIEQLSVGGESVAVVTASQPSTVILPPTYDLPAAARAVDRIEQTAGGTDLPGAFAAAIELGRQHARQPVRRLEIITDGTRSAWEQPRGDRLPGLARDASSLFKIRHFNLAQPDQWNAAVTRVAPTASLIRVGFNTELSASVRAFGRSTSAPLQWSVDGQPADGARTVEASPESPPVTQSDTRFRTGGTHVVAATFAAGDKLRMDDVRHRVVDVASGVKVLIVEGERGGGALASSGAFLDLALAPPAEAGTGNLTGERRSASYIAPLLISEIELGNHVLSDYRAVVLAGLAQVSPEQADQLKRFVEAGGTLILFMGEPVVPEAYTRTLLPRGLLPGPLTRRISAAADQKGFTFDFKPLGSLHPLLRTFAAQENTGLDTAQVFTYVQVELPSDTAAERVLDYTPRDGRTDAAITLHTLGGGRVVYFSTSANAQWTSLPAKPAYVALMHEILAGSVSTGDAWMNRVVGESLELPATLLLKASPSLLDPTGQQVLLQPEPAGDGRTVHRSPRLKLPGVYQVNTGGATLPIAVTCPAEEADIRPVTDATLRAAMGAIDVELEGDQLPAAAIAGRGGNDFGWIVMLALLLLVCAESLMALKFGHHRKP